MLKRILLWAARRLLRGQGYHVHRNRGKKRPPPNGGNEVVGYTTYTFFANDQKNIKENG